MAEVQCMKAKALSKETIVLLLDLITKHEVIITRATNATNKKLKEEAWRAIAQEFSALTGDNRRPEQLRLKWENLKKAARKRSALIRQNNLKTGGGKAFIPPDEILDRVASVLGATCTGLTVEFGGDGVHDGAGVCDAVVDIMDLQPLPEPPLQAQASAGVPPVHCGDGDVQAGGGSEIFTPKIFTFNTPNKGLNKRRKISEDLQRAQTERELKMAAYFQAKTERVQSDERKLDLESRRLELENEKLELELRQLRKNNCE